jgi:hypothetical protein
MTNWLDIWDSLNLVEASGPVQACNGIALPLSGTSANLQDVETVRVLRDELTCKKEIKDTYKTEEILQQNLTQHTGVVVSP